MTREAFLTKLREGLAGLPATAIADIMTDYEAHFIDGVAAGRDEEEIAAALGDPKRLARELKVEAGLKRWEAERNPAAAAGAIVGVLGLATLDVVILLPILLTVGAVLLGVSIALIAVFFAGCWVFVSGLTGAGPQDASSPLQSIFAGLGLMTGSVSILALLALLVVALVNALVWYARLHFRLIKPAVGA